MMCTVCFGWFLLHPTSIRTPPLLQALADALFLPQVHTYAASAIERMLTVRDSNGARSRTCSPLSGM
eukprot:401936-Pleurochrysis_carterae.AAC.3